jgi:peptidoglycan/xylan/chitin deacetylase (PgdA/CDA1 family)
LGQVLLTFDTEDFAGEHSIWFLHKLLLSLKEFDWQSLFFVTGHMAEKIKDNLDIVNLLKAHVIGYHSSSHSVRPTIFEFTDIENYGEAYDLALKRETSHINPFNGRTEGEGGIYAVSSLCKNREILAYRAPGFCWSPPHTEALRDLGIRFDFSANFSEFPVFYRDITFYPFPALREWSGSLGTNYYRLLLSSILRKKITVVSLHPDWFVNYSSWDSVYHKGNPEHITVPVPRANSEFQKMFQSFRLFLKRAKQLENLGIVEISANLEKSERVLSVTQKKIEEFYDHSMRWPRKYFDYEPRYLRKHFSEFFSQATLEKENHSSNIR